MTSSPQHLLQKHLLPKHLLRRMACRTPARLTLLAAASMAGACALTLLPAAVGRTIDVLLTTTAAGRTPPTRLWTWIAASAALAVTIACGDALVQLTKGTATGNSTGWLRHELLRHILACGPRIASRFTPGDAVSRLIGGSVEAAGAPPGAVLTLTAAIPAFGSVIALGLIDPWLALTFVAGMPVLALALRAFMRDTSAVILRYQHTQGAIAGRLVDAMLGARTIAAAGTRDQEIERVLTPLPSLRAHGYQTWRVQGRIAAQSGALVPALQVLILAVGGIALTAHRITPGELLAASQYAALGTGIGAAIGQLNLLARGRSGATRVLDLLNVPPPEQGSARLPTGAGRRGAIEFRNISVERNEALPISNVDFLIPPGAAVAVVGPTGAGKSTIAALAGRLLDPTSGEVLLDGVPLTRLARTELRTAVSYAFERPALLGETVADMIGFGIEHPPADAVEQAARAARADQFIERLPAGYRTPLTTAPLSGGEVQRLGLARAFAHAEAARVLVLDDATSSLDTVTEMEVSQALTELHADRTKIIVTHRAATAASADLVAWLADGRLQAPLAPHRELWHDPSYRAVFASSEETSEETQQTATETGSR